MAQSAATKEELLSEIERLNAQIADLNDQLAQQAAASRESNSGWMISTPNPEYTGRTAGVYFEKGHAFIPSSRKNAPYLVRLLTNDYGYSASEATGTEKMGPAEKVMSVAAMASMPSLKR